MKKLFYLTFLMTLTISLKLSSQDIISTNEEYQSLVDSGMVIIYRPPKFVGALAPLSVKLNGELIGHLANGGKMKLTVKKGVNFFQFGYTDFKIDVKEGKKYALIVEGSFWKGIDNPNIKLVEDELLINRMIEDLQKINRKNSMLSFRSNLLIVSPFERKILYILTEESWLEIYAPALGFNIGLQWNITSNWSSLLLFEHWVMNESEEIDGSLSTERYLGLSSFNINALYNLVGEEGIAMYFGAGLGYNFATLEYYSNVPGYPYVNISDSKSTIGISIFSGIDIYFSKYIAFTMIYRLNFCNISDWEANLGSHAFVMGLRFDVPSR
ncbi:MAG: hypothetical protein ABIN61_09180 [candidate division WOR-3 bacterium]